jgi:two-component system phosphate regulon sensor histidine kinase PhoR
MSPEAGYSTPGRRRRLLLWLIAARPVALLLSLAALTGWLIGTPATIIAISLGLYATWQLRKARDLEHWLRRSRSLEQPQGDDVWSEARYLVHRQKERHRAEKTRLLATIREFRDAIEALPDGALLLDGQDRILWFNRPACQLLGLRYPTDRFARFTNLVRQPEVLQWLSSAHGERPHPMFLDVGGDGERILSLNLVVYREQQRIIIVRDVTERRRLEEMRRDFVANVSHELRTPLTVMNGYLEILDDDIEPRFRPAMGEMQRQAHRMRKLVDDLLQLARHERSDALAPNEHVDGRWLQQTLAADAEALSAGRHDISFELEPGVALLGSAQSLHSAFSNLLSNAIRYTPDGGHIRIRLARSAEGAIFDVSDTGCGIESQHLPRLTERFYRVSAARSRATGGTGLGLAIVKHILRQHEARLVIHSIAGEGSTFSCFFPSQRVTESLNVSNADNQKPRTERLPS